MAPATGLFTSGLSDSLGGSYHINPLSETCNPQHLSYFRFAGRLFGKVRFFNYYEILYILFLFL